MPIFNEFKPDFVLISCGFDSCKDDELGNLELTPIGYYYMVQKLKELAQG